MMNSYPGNKEQEQPLRKKRKTIRTTSETMMQNEIIDDEEDIDVPPLPPPLSLPPLTPVTSAYETVTPVTSAYETLAPVTSALGTLPPVTSAFGTLAPVTSALGTVARVSVTPAYRSVAPITSTYRTVASTYRTMASVTSAYRAVAPVTSALGTLAPVTSALGTVAQVPVIPAYRSVAPITSTYRTVASTYRTIAPGTSTYGPMTSLTNLNIGDQYGSTTNDPLIFNNYDAPFPYGTGGHYAATYHRDANLISHGMPAWSPAEVQRCLQGLEERIVLLEEKVAGNTSTSTETTNDGDNGLPSALLNLSSEHKLAIQMILARKTTWTVALRKILLIVFSQQVLAESCAKGRPNTSSRPLDGPKLNAVKELIFKSFLEERIQEGAMNTIVNSACAGARRAVRLTHVQ